MYVFVIQKYFKLYVTWIYFKVNNVHNYLKAKYLIAGLQIFFFSLEGTYVLPRHHLGRTKQNFGRTTPKTKG